MANKAEISEEAIANALDAAKRDADAARTRLSRSPNTLAMDGEATFLAECVSVEIKGNEVCLKLPFVGDVCIPLPISPPSGTLAEVCASLCTKFGIPTGVRVTVSVAGQTVVSKTFGIC